MGKKKGVVGTVVDYLKPSTQGRKPGSTSYDAQRAIRDRKAEIAAQMAENGGKKKGKKK